VKALASSYTLGELARRPEDYPAGYLVHEFMHTGWDAPYVTDVRRELATIGLMPAGSATLIENFDSWVISHDARALLAEIADADLRELVRDFFIDQRFRCDVFSRDATRLAPAVQRRRLAASSFALTRPESAVAYSTASPAGRLVFDNPAARAIVAGLVSGPRPLGDIADDTFGRGKGISDGDLVANALALSAAGEIRPVEPTRAPVAAVNAALRRRLGSAEEVAVLALPCGTALDIDHTLRGLLAGARPDVGGWHAFLAAQGV
jgi:hypothetical protein